MCYPIFRVGFLLVAVLACVSIPHKSVLSQDNKVVDFQKLSQPVRERRVRVALEVRGNLNLNSDGAAIREMPLEVSGELDYEERRLPAIDSGQQYVSLRYYRNATADMKVGSTKFRHALRDSATLIAAECSDSRFTLTSLKSPLTQEEMELLNVQGNSLLLHRLLPTQGVDIGDTWHVETDDLARLLCLDLVTKSDVTMKLVQVEDHTAVIEGMGEVDGIAGGVASHIQLKAKVNVDTDNGLVTWLAASIVESRSIGHAEPGFDVTARLRVAVQPRSTSEHLSDSVVAAYREDANKQRKPLMFESRRAGIRLLHDRRWRAMVDHHDLCVFRMVDQGDLIAQCNVSPLPDRGNLGALTLAEFQLDIQKTLGEQFGQIVNASREDGESSKTILRVVVEGMVSDVPVKWIYYHVTNQDGHRAALAFTFETELQEVLGTSDRTMVDSVEFLPLPEPDPAQSSSSS